MPANDQQNAWVRAVLGVGVGERVPQGPDFARLAPDLSAARQGLVAARDAMSEAFSRADVQVRKLQGVLGLHPDEQLKDISRSPEFGINALTGNQRVRLLAALRDVEAAPPEKLPGALKKARDLAGRFEAFVRTDAKLEACDLNPLNVPLDVRGTIAPALTQVAGSLDRFAA